jgi:hypothetical protein
MQDRHFGLRALTRRPRIPRKVGDDGIDRRVAAAAGGVAETEVGGWVWGGRWRRAQEAEFHVVADLVRVDRGGSHQRRVHADAQRVQ